MWSPGEITRDGRFGSKVGQIRHKMVQIRDFFRSDFSTFGDEPNVLKSDLKKSRICSRHSMFLDLPDLPPLSIQRIIFYIVLPLWRYNSHKKDNSHKKGSFHQLIRWGITTLSDTLKQKPLKLSVKYTINLESTCVLEIISTKKRSTCPSASAACVCGELPWNLLLW